MGFEIKYLDSPKVTNSMHTAQELLKLDELTIVVPGQKVYPMTEKVMVKRLKVLM